MSGDRRQGRYNKLTASEIERVRIAYRNWYNARRERWALMDELNISEKVFGDVGCGLSGKKPRPEGEIDQCRPVNGAAARCTEAVASKRKPRRRNLSPPAPTMEC